MSDFFETGVRLPDLNPDSFRARLHEAKGEHTAQKVAELSGLSKKTIEGYLSFSRKQGKGLPGIERIVALADALSVNLDWLATGRGPKKINQNDGHHVDTKTLDFSSLENPRVKFSSIWSQLHQMHDDFIFPVTPDLAIFAFEIFLMAIDKNESDQREFISEQIENKRADLKARRKAMDDQTQPSRKSA